MRCHVDRIKVLNYSGSCDHGFLTQFCVIFRIMNTEDKDDAGGEEELADKMEVKFRFSLLKP